MLKQQVYKFYTEDLAVRAAVAITTDVVREITEFQQTSPIATIALGRALSAAVLLGSQLNEKYRIGLKFEGNGPLGFVFAESSFECEVRGFCMNPQVNLPPVDGKWNLTEAVGEGVLRVSRGTPYDKHPYHGIVPLKNGEISQDVAHYLFRSQQIPSVVSLSVQLDKDAKVIAAGGVLVELMPGADDSIIKKIEAKASSAPSLGKKILSAQGAKEIAADYVHDSPLVEFEHPFPIKYHCRCNEERVDRTLTLLGRATLSEMILKGETLKIACQFCGKKFEVEVDKLRTLLDTLRTTPGADTGSMPN